MSFDVSLYELPCYACKRSGDEVYGFNITHNLNAIVDICLQEAGMPVAKKGDSSYAEYSWGRLRGWRAADLIPILQTALAISEDPEREKQFRELEPSNRWGQLENVRKAFRELLTSCFDSPDCVLEAVG